MFVFNQGEVCICLLCSLIQVDIYDEFLELVVIWIKVVWQGDLLDIEIMLGFQVFNDQLEKVLFYIEIGK